MKRNFKKTVSLILAVLMVMAFVPFGGMAADCEHEYEFVQIAGQEAHWKVCGKCGAIDYPSTGKCSGGTPEKCGEKAKCTACGGYWGEALEHTFEEETIADKFYVEGTGDCENPKMYYYNCVNEGCDAIGTETFEGALGDHKPDAGVSNGDAECGVDGTLTISCTVCGDVLNELAPDVGSALEHDFTKEVESDDRKVAGSVATCEEGAKYYLTCSRPGCDEWSDTLTFVGEADEDAHNFLEMKDPDFIKSEATCLKPAVYYKWCSVCGKTSKTLYGKDTDKVFTYGEPHEKPTVDNGFKVVKPAEADESEYLILNADCLNDAMYSMLCERCKVPMAKTVDEAKKEGFHFYWKAGTATNPGHRDIKDMTETQKAVAATCTEAAIPAIYKCPKDGCGAVVERYPENAVFDKDGKSIPLGHTFDKTKSKAYVEPGCVTEGEYAEETCSVCKTTLYFDKDGTERSLAYTLTNPIKNLGGHKDANGDEWCDKCEIHVTPQDTCTCICHQSGGLMYFVALILKWFWKLTGTKPTCPAPCGQAHY